MISSYALRTFVPDALKKNRAPPLKIGPKSGSPTKRLQDAVANFTCVGTGVQIDPSVHIVAGLGLSVGNDVQIGRNAYIDAEGGVMLGSGVRVGEGVTILSSLPMPQTAQTPGLHNEHVWAEVFIGDGVRIGPGACIMPGVSIGKGALIEAGTLVTSNVPAGTAFGCTHACGPKNAMPPVLLDDSSAIPATDPTALRPLKARVQQPDICFVASTGRSGSTTIANLLNDHPDIIAKHEPRLSLVKLSTEYAHGILSRAQTKARLERMFLDGSVFHEDRVYVESDLKYFNLFPILSEIFPEARFVWLVRNGYDVVTSTYARSWFGDSSHPVWNSVPWLFHKYRVQGDHSGDVTPEDWATMTPFQRNCWYWAYVNRTIERDMAEIPGDRTFLLRLEELGSVTDDLLSFLGFGHVDLEARQTNKAFYDKAGPDTWSNTQKADFERICGPMMKRLYG